MPLRTIVALGRLMWAVHSAALVLLVDQIEEVVELSRGDTDPGAVLRGAINTLVDVADGLPSALLGYRRLAPQQKLLVLHNLDATRTLEVKTYLPRRATRLWPAAPASRKTRLAPGETAIWTLR